MEHRYFNSPAKKFFGAFLGGALLLPQMLHAEIPAYHVIDIGTLGGNYTTAYDINDKGQVTGESHTANAESRAFLYANGIMKDLGTLGGSQSWGVALNNAGQVTGDSINAEGEVHAFLYTSGLMTDLGTLGGTYSSAAAINNRGQVAGVSTPIAGEYIYHAFRYSEANGLMEDLDTFGTEYSVATAMNDAGEVSGVYDVNFESHAFLYTYGGMIDLVPATSSYIEPYAQTINRWGHVAGQYRASPQSVRGFLYQNGNLIDIGTLGGESSVAVAINDAGKMTGGATTASGDTHAFRYANGVMKDLGTLGGNYSYGHAINRAGDVTGVARDGTGLLFPFVYHNGKMLRLEIEALGAVQGWGDDINKKGEVIGFYEVIGTDGFESRAFLATPIPLMFSRLIEQLEGRALEYFASAASALYKAEMVKGSCLALAYLVKRAESASSHSSGVVSQANAIRDALRCTAVN